MSPMQGGAVGIVLAIQASGCAVLSGLSDLEEVPTNDAADSSAIDAGSASSSADASSNHETGETATCPPPGAGDLHVSPTGNDVTGNGSSTCPFKTITKAIAATVGKGVFTTITLHKTAI